MVDVTKHAEKSISGGIAGAVVGLYGVDVNKSRMAGKSSNPEWVSFPDVERA
jgi:hypothetical protein